ncbi:hypothetical protein Q8G28_03630 [Lysinibacillus capsici]|uniref:hypothetical protein n=1 Tax=Lysinibacillus capsici TaxID=2115968 RepID=UPI002731D2C0|nr:hypothetical protein [Lysinibacillus capsici]MDP1392053.1 hypothetical protein [Lysinibacillus capsici]MDP1412529.1 hypothetical protein [Lysinibacillus capsici]MDP1428839.1 hypothetical protein [Lysinibacillus capsici]
MTVAVKNFSSIMNQMRDAYTGEQTKEFSLAAFIGLQAPSLSDAPDELQKLTQEYQENINSFYVHEELDLKENVKQLENDKNQTAFFENMRKKKEEALKKSEDMINKYYDSLIDFGEEHPAAQTLILTIADKVGAFIQDIMDKVLNVFVTVVETVKNAISAAINFISSTFNSIVSTTKNFFSSLF